MDDKRLHRSLQERIRIYNEVARNHASGLGRKEIAAAVGISPDEVYYWLHASPPHVERYDPDLAPRPELAYLVGAYLGDGRTAGELDKKVRFNVADPAFAESLNELVAKILGAELKPVSFEYGFHSVSYDSAVLYDYLQQPLPAFSALINQEPNAFLQGFFDAEGYVTQSVSENKGTFNSVSVGAANCSVEYLEAVARLLRTLSIDSSIRTTNKAGQPMVIRGKEFIRKHDVRHIEIRRLDCVRLFQTHVDFSIPKKRQKLRDLLVIMSNTNPRNRFALFTSQYHKVGRKWERKTME